VTNMAHMFQDASFFNQDISEWDVSLVTDMASVFELAASPNQDISGRDVSSVTSMAHMFQDASLFDQDISEWDVSSVTDMASMLALAASFNHDIRAGRLLNDQQGAHVPRRILLRPGHLRVDVSSVIDIGLYVRAGSLLQP
jgi:surface protein